MRKKDFKSYDDTVVYERKKKKKKKSHHSGRGYYGGLFGDGTSTGDAAAVGECSGYIPKNEKEAKDPRWSMALTNDVKPGEEQRNLKKLGLK